MASTFDEPKFQDIVSPTMCTYLDSRWKSKYVNQFYNKNGQGTIPT